MHLWSFFNNSAKRTAAYGKAVMTMKEINLSAKEGKEWQRALKRHAERRGYQWIMQLKGCLMILSIILCQTLHTMKEGGDSLATGLLKQSTNIKFLSTVYMLHAVLPTLAHLSKAFQKGNVSFAAMHITLNGPEVKYSSQLIQDSVKQWKVKPRRKIAKGKEAARPAFSDAAVQADLDPAITPNLEILQQEAELLEKEAQMLEEEAEMWEQEVNSALKILNLPQPDTFSDSSDGDSDDKE